MTKKHATSTSSTNDKAYFSESPTGEVTKTNSVAVPAEPQITTVTTAIEQAAEPYQQSAHKVVVKRYAIKRD